MKKIRIIFILFITKIVLLSANINVFAKSRGEELSTISANIQHRIGHAGYLNYYHYGSTTTGQVSFEVKPINKLLKKI